MGTERAATATKMVDLDLTEASAVDMPANLMPGWLVLKSLDGELAQWVLDQAAVLKAADTSTPDGEAGGGTQATDPEPAPGDDEQVNTPGPGQDDEPVAPDSVSKGATMDEAALTARIAELEAQLAVAKAATTASPELDPVAKALGELPEPVRKHLEGLNARAEEAERVAKAERDHRLDAEYVAKARSLATNLPVDPVAFARHLRAATEAVPEAAAAFVQVLKAADAALADARPYGEVGSSAAAADDGSAMSKINAAAHELVAKSTTALSFPEAQAQVLSSPEGARLYAQYQAERARAAAATPAL